jgi:predicted O-methyltransferase YrrM
MTRVFADVWTRARAIEGWLTEGQAQMLYRTAARVAPGEAIVEIGSHCGRSTVILGSAKPRYVRLIAIDPYTDARWGGGSTALARFEANVASHGLEREVEQIRQFGAEAGRRWDGEEVGLLFVDGAHDYASVDADLRAWLPHLSPTATVLMHDAYSSPGVTRAAFHHFYASSKFAFVGSSRSLVAFQRCPQSRMARAASALRMLEKVPWLARNLAIKLAIRRGWRSLPPLLGHREAAFPY